MDILSLFSLQGTLFAMMLIGALLKKRGIIDRSGERCLTDLCVNIIIPCNIFRSCLIRFDMEVFRVCARLLLSAVLLRILCLVLNKVLFNRYPRQRKKVLKNAVTHPCLVAVYLGVFCMVTQIPLPAMVTETVRYIGNCNSALTMFIVGTILADVRPAAMLDRDAVKFSVFRLILLPARQPGLLVADFGLDLFHLGHDFCALACRH